MKRHLDLGTPKGGTIHGNAERAVRVLKLIRQTFPEVESLEFEFNGTPCVIDKSDSANSAVAEYWDERELRSGRRR